MAAGALPQSAQRPGALATWAMACDLQVHWHRIAGRPRAHSTIGQSRAAQSCWWMSRRRRLKGGAGLGDAGQGEDAGTGSELLVGSRLSKQIVIWGRAGTEASGHLGLEHLRQPVAGRGGRSDSTHGNGESGRPALEAGDAGRRAQPATGAHGGLFGHRLQVRGFHPVGASSASLPAGASGAHPHHPHGHGKITWSRCCSRSGSDTTT